MPDYQPLSSVPASSPLKRLGRSVGKAARVVQGVTGLSVALLFKTLVVLYFAACAVILGVRYLVLPSIDSYKPNIEQLVSRAVGAPVAIGQIQASWSGLHPRLSLQAVHIQGEDGKAALTLPEVSATLAWHSMLVANLRLSNLEIKHADLHIVRTADGRISVGGILIDPGAPSEGRGAEWLLSQREILIRDSRIRWTDHVRQSAELVLDDVTIALRNRWRTHRLSIVAKPPPGMSAPLDVRMVFQHPPFARRISEYQRWYGEVYLDVRDTDLAVWRAYVDYPFEVESGRGAVRAWLDFDRAHMVDFTADVALSSVSARLRDDLSPLRLTHVSGRIGVRENMDPRSFSLSNVTSVFSDSQETRRFGGDGHAISLSEFSLLTEDGLHLPATTISERYFPAQDGALSRTEIAVQSLDLETIAKFADHLPLPDAHRQLLEQLAPTGTIRDVSAQWSGDFPQVSSYNVRGEFEKLGLRARPVQTSHGKAVKQVVAGDASFQLPSTPGFKNLSGRIEANERRGQLTLASKNFSLELPQVFQKATLPFENLDLQANWQVTTDDALLLDLQRLDFIQEGIVGTLSGRNLIPLANKEPLHNAQVDLIGKIARVDIARVKRYLPLQTDETLHHWLSGGLLGGRAEDVRVRLKGKLGDFPYSAAQVGQAGADEFSVHAKLVDAVLNYSPDEQGRTDVPPEWPIIDKINGTISFVGERMDIRADRARTSGTTLSKVHVSIDDLSDDDAVLHVVGDATGPLQHFIQFTHRSPVGEWIDHFTSDTQASGDAKLALKLDLPLDRMEESKVHGALYFSGNTVKLTKDLPLISQASGRLEFNEQGFSIPGVRASFLGGPATVAGGTQANGLIDLRIDGTATALALRQTIGLPETGANSERISGSARYQAAVRVKDGNPSVMVESNLAALGLDFPAPLSKKIGETMPLRFEVTQAAESDNLLSQDEVHLTLGSAIRAHYRRERPAAPGAAWRVVSGGYAIDAPLPTPASGVAGEINMKRLDIDAWQAIAEAIGSDDTAAPAASASILRQHSSTVSQYVEPETLRLRVAEMAVMDRTLNNVSVNATRHARTWQMSVEAAQASGELHWTPPRTARGSGELRARLSSLSIPKSEVQQVEAMLGTREQLPRFAALDIAVANFELFGMPLGSLQLNAANARGSEGWEWQINRLELTNPDGAFSASGKWAGRADATQTKLDYKLAMHDAGKLLGRFGFSDVIKGGKGTMAGDIAWIGAPFALDVPSLNGEVRLDLTSGQFMKVDAASQGAAKLLGVLSLQSLPRRFTLDFRDIFSEGFAFDGINALATITNGVAKTDSFKMRSVSATVLIDGSADIAREEQNLHVVVIPEINAGAASLMYGLAVNPAIGVGTFLAQLFLREPLMKAFTFQYQISGPWKEPNVTKIVREADALKNSAQSQASNG